jgi:hypothetical protein
MPDLFYIFLIVMLSAYVVCYEIGRRINKLEERLIDEIQNLNGKGSD